MFLEIFHISVFVLNSFTIWYDQMYVDLPFPTKEIEAMPLKARYLFLTVWCLVFQALYFFVSFLNDIYGTNSPTPKNAPLIRKFKDAMFSVAFSLAIYVSMAFWGIYAVDKDLIFPKEISSNMPVWINHVMHTLIAPFILIELLATNVKYPSRKFGFGLVMTLIMSYIVWVNVVYFQTGFWVYPFMAFFGWPMHFAFYSVSTIVGYNVYVLGEYLNKIVSSGVKVYTNGTGNGVHNVKKKH